MGNLAGSAPPDYSLKDPSSCPEVLQCNLCKTGGELPPSLRDAGRPQIMDSSSSSSSISRSTSMAVFS